MPKRVLSTRIPEGTLLTLGVPAKPLHTELVRSIAEVAAAEEKIEEAHLPNFSAAGQETASQALVLVFSDISRLPECVERVSCLLRNVLPPEVSLDMWPLPSNHPMLGAIRSVGCRIFTRGLSGEPVFDEPLHGRRKWWQIW